MPNKKKKERQLKRKRKWKTMRIKNGYPLLDPERGQPESQLVGPQAAERGEEEVEHRYSILNVSAGSTRDARQAGITPASRPTAPSTPSATKTICQSKIGTGTRSGASSPIRWPGFATASIRS